MIGHESWDVMGQVIGVTSTHKVTPSSVSGEHAKQRHPESEPHTISSILCDLFAPNIKGFCQTANSWCSSLPDRHILQCKPSDMLQMHVAFKSHGIPWLSASSLGFVRYSPSTWNCSYYVDNHMNKCEINPKTIHHRYLPSDSITFFVSEASTRKDTQKLSRFAPGHGKKWTKKVDGHPERDSPATSSYRSSLGKVSCSAHSHGTPASGRIKPKVIHGNPIPRSEVFRLNMLNIGKWSQS